MLATIADILTVAIGTPIAAFFLWLGALWVREMTRD
jgi:hypothetical protein